MADKMITVILIEDDDEIRESLNILINESKDIKCIGQFGDCESAIKKINNLYPDVILMDISLPGMNGIEGVKRIREIDESIDIIMLTVHKNDEMIFDSLCSGASGYLMKNTPYAEIIEAIKEVRKGGSPMSTDIARRIVTSFRAKKSIDFTSREHEVLGLLCKGLSYKSIADKLFISIDTVHFHIKNIYKKLHVNSKSQAVAKAIKEKLV